MFNDPFYFSLVRKYVILVGTLFNNIHITRTDSNNVNTALIKVPITYGPKDKMLARVNDDVTLDRETAVMPLPMLSFEMGNMYYDRDRKLNKVGRIAKKDANDADKFKSQYNPVPYNIDFKVYIYAKHVEDANKILEQILPFFTPDWTTSVNLIPEVDVTMDIPIILRSINYEDNYDGSYKDRRAVVWTLDLVLKGYFYGPVKETGVIKFINTNYYIPAVPDGQLQSAVGNTNIAEKVTIQPGLTANGTPTSNISETIAYTLIDADDDFGYIEITYNTEDLYE